MPSPLQTNVFEIGQACALRLVALKVVPDASQILWCARKKALPHLKGKFDLVMRPRKNQDIKSLEQGGQRFGMVCIRVIDFIVRTSYGGAEVGNDETWLAQHIPFEDMVLNALAGQMLQDTTAAKNEYLTCPIHYLGTTEEEREDDVKVSNLWGHSVLSFEFHFKPKLDLTQTT